MEHAESQAPSDLPIDALAELNKDAIVTAVADQFHEQLDTLRVVPGRSFRSEVDGTPSFWVQNEAGAYGVNGKLNEAGRITDITVMRVQL